MIRIGPAHEISVLYRMLRRVCVYAYAQTHQSIRCMLGTRPWTNRFTSASTTIVSSSSQSPMVDPDWIHILGKQRLPCVKGKVTVYVTCQCSENRCFWSVKDHKYQRPCCVAWCIVLTASYNPQDITLFYSI